jgi:hypothetical protein
MSKRTTKKNAKNQNAVPTMAANPWTTLSTGFFLKFSITYPSMEVWNQEKNLLNF